LGARNVLPFHSAVFDSWSVFFHRGLADFGDGGFVVFWQRCSFGVIFAFEAFFRQADHRPWASAFISHAGFRGYKLHGHKRAGGCFFVALGLHFFLGYIEEAKLESLLWSGICFLFASWARIESLMFMGVSAVFILFAPRKKLTGRAVFLIPVVGILAAVAVS
jgi:hypothetical protein